MATRSTIALELQNGKIKQVYCHWDGYLNGVGKTLLEHYPMEKMKILMKIGDIRALYNTIDETQFFYDETPVHVHQDFAVFLEERMIEEYNYFMDKNGQLFLLTKDNNCVMKLPLTELEVA